MFLPCLSACRFGLGFNAVYHLTDLPSFVSGQHLVLFDPHAKYLPGAAGLLDFVLACWLCVIAQAVLLVLAMSVLCRLTRKPETCQVRMRCITAWWCRYAILYDVLPVLVWPYHCSVVILPLCHRSSRLIARCFM